MYIRDCIKAINFDGKYYNIDFADGWYYETYYGVGQRSYYHLTSMNEVYSLLRKLFYVENFVGTLQELKADRVRLRSIAEGEDEIAQLEYEIEWNRSKIEKLKQTIKELSDEYKRIK
jgi:hypothetical protein